MNRFWAIVDPPPSPQDAVDATPEAHAGQTRPAGCPDRREVPPWRSPYTPAVATCTICGETNLDSARYCSSCGAQLRPDEDRREDREERRVVTVLFCDPSIPRRASTWPTRSHVRDSRAFPSRPTGDRAASGGTVAEVPSVTLCWPSTAFLRRRGDDAERALFSALRILPLVEQMNEGAQIPCGADRNRDGRGDRRPRRRHDETGDGVPEMWRTWPRASRRGADRGDLVGEPDHRATRSACSTLQAMGPVRVKGRPSTSRC